jgi:mono/diheme cytochrome c family protein
MLATWLVAPAAQAAAQSPPLARPAEQSALPATAAGQAAPPVAAAGQSALLARGAYLADLGDCGSCHTASGGRKFAGGRYMPTPFGPISTPNITPDTATGIGDWTDDQFYAALHDGIGRHGEHLYPVMPFPWYTKVTRDDALAIKAYLFSLPPVHAPRPPSHLAFPFNIRAGLAVWDELFLRKGTFRPDPTQSAEVNRGAYIVEALGHCGECHNGRNLLGDTAMADSLGGGPIEHWYAPNITSDVRDGIGKYSENQLFHFLKDGVAPGMGVAAGPMAETVHDSLSKLTDDDVHAIIAYLRSTPAKSSYVSAERTAFTGRYPAGRGVYLNNCASCHQLDGRGTPGAVPALAGNGAVLAKGPDDVIRVVLGGLEAQGEYAPMPAVGTTMSDQDIADVVNYIRQAWGNEAPPNAGPGEVAALRPTTFTAMRIGPDGHCDTVVQPDLARAINDPATGIMAALRAMTPDTLLQTAGLVVSKIKAAATHADRADIVNSLTIAYCPIVEHDTGIASALKVAALDHFSERVYSELYTGGHE